MDEKHNIIGLITYHAAYNYGSVLQAYATQSTITDMGHDVTVIDYRPLEGERYYERLYWRGLGLKSSLADLTMLPVAGLRKKRMRNFERFINTNIHVGQRRYQEPEELNSLADAFDVAVSGSDPDHQQAFQRAGTRRLEVHGPVPAEMGELQENLVCFVAGHHDRR